MKIYFKQFFVMILSWSLLSMQVGFVYAEEGGGGFVFDEGQVVKGQNGTATRTATVTDNDADEDMSGSGALSMITMLAIGVVTWRILDMCADDPTTDIYIAAAAGAAFIIGEVVAIFGYTDERKKQMEVVIGNTDEGEKQVEALKQQRDTYQDIHDTAQTKFYLQAAAAVGFGAAAAVAGYQWYSINAAMEACVAGCTALEGAAATIVPPFQSAAACALPLKGASGLALYYEEVTDPSKVVNREIDKKIKGIKSEFDSCKNANSADRTTASSMTPANTAIEASLSATEGALPQAKTGCEELFILMEEGGASCRPDESDGDSKKPETESEGLGMSDALGVAGGVAPLLFSGGDDKDKDKEEEKTEEEKKTDEHKKEQERKQQEQKTIQNKQLKEAVNKALPKDKKADLGSIEQTPEEFLNALLGEAKKDILISKAKKSDDYDPEIFFESFMDKVMNFVTPKAEAINLGIMQGIGIGGVVLGAVTALATDFSFEWDNFFATPGKRAIIWAGLGGLTVGAMMQTSKVMDKAEDKVKKLNEIIERMEQLNTGVNNINENKSKAGGKVTPIAQRLRTAKTSGNKDMKINDQKFPCTVKTSNGKCASLKKSILADSGFNKLGGTLGGVAANLGGLADSTANKPLVKGSTLDLAADIGKKKNAIDNILRKTFKKVNLQRARNGKRPVNVSRLGKRYFDKLQASSKNRLQRGGMTNASAAKAFGLSPLANGSKSLGDSKKSLKPKSKRQSYSKSSGKGSGNYKKSNGKYAMSFDEDEGISKANKNDLATDSEKANALNEVEDFGDIVSNKDAFLFDVISSRYIKSGYSRLLE